MNDCHSVCNARGVSCEYGVLDTGTSCGIGETVEYTNFDIGHCLCSQGCGEGNPCALGEQCVEDICV